MKEIELKNLRKEHEKHFLQENGDIIAKVFSDNIHCKKNGKYEEIDNKLIKENDYYINRCNDYKTHFHEVSNSYIMKINKDNYYLSISLNNTNNVSAEVANDNIRYNGIIDGIDLEYILLPTKVKENIIINNKVDMDKLIFFINTNLELVLTEDGTIQALANNKEVFTIESPFMIDANKDINNNINYKLLSINGTYQLVLELDCDWLCSAEYPVIIDPTITNTGQNTTTYDTYIYSGDTGVDRNSHSVLIAGVEKIGSTNRINRTLIKFDLPTIGTGSQIREAEIFLIPFPTSYGIDFNKKIVDIHRITTDWDETTANWNTMHDKYDQKKIINYALTDRNMETYDSELGEHKLLYTTADITDLVRKWYAGTPNYGILIKSHKEEYIDNNFPAFISKNNGSSNGFNPQPTLVIRYRNENGLEGYMNYLTQEFTDGSIFVNSFNGNLTGVFNVGSTIAGKFPASLDLIYNTNDVILNNNVGLGTGYKFSLYQTIKEVEIEETNYMEYVDEDGTIHYFREDNDDGVFYDEDGLDMTITKEDNNYTLLDKNGNSIQFIINNGIGYLTEIKNISENKIQVKYDDNNRIIKVVDANEDEINIAYESNKVSIISPSRTTYLNYTDSKIADISTLSGTTLFTYNSNNIISSITDVNGLKIAYEYYEQIPYRTKKVIQYGLNDTLGESFSLDYDYNLTSVTDNKGRVTTYSFNNWANVMSVTNLTSTNDLKNAYAQETNYGENEQYKNKLLSSGIPIRYVKNYIDNSSFETRNTLFWDSNLWIEESSEDSVSGLGSLKASTATDGYMSEGFDVPKGKYYTFSAYIKSDIDVTIEVSCDSIQDGFNSESAIVRASEDFIRGDVSIYLPEDATSELIVNIIMLESGNMYIDDIQLEEGEVANRYNMLSNSDFSNGISDWALWAMSEETYDDINPDPYITLIDVNEFGDKAINVNMSIDVRTSFSKLFNAVGKAGELYQVSFWYKNEGLYASGIVGNTVRNNVDISFHYTDEAIGHGTPTPKPLNANSSEWQYYSASFLSLYDFNGFELYFDQSDNINSISITNICLFKDVRNYSLDYDDSGNLITESGLNNSPNLFNYDTNNQLIKMTSPSGNSLSYEYDNKITDRLIRGTSKTGISNSIEYDENGNPTITRISYKGLEDITNGTYQIRAKGTNKYIRYVNGALVLDDDDCGHDKCIIDSNNEEYTISHSILDDRYLSIQSNTLILSQLSSKFLLIKQANGSYRIGLKDESLESTNPNYVSRDTIDTVISECIPNELTIEEIINEFVVRNFIGGFDMELAKAKSINNALLTEPMLSHILKDGPTDWDEFENDDYWNYEYRKLLNTFIYYTLNKIEDCLYLKQNEDIVDTGNLIEEDYKFEFYLESTDNELFIENSSIYTEDGKFITSTTDTNFNTVSYEIDPSTGLTTSVTDSMGNLTNTIYDDKRRVQEINSIDKKVEYTYNSQNLLSSIKEGAKEYKFTYDNFLNNKEVKIGDNITLVTNNCEDNNGNLTSSVYGNGDIINFSYDKFDRITTLTKMDDTYHYKYNSEGDLVRVVSDNEEVRYTYGLSKKLNEYSFNDFRIKYTYGRNDNLTKKTYRISNSINNVYNTFDREDQIIKIEHDNIETNYIYDDLGRLKSKNVNDLLNTDYEYLTNGKRTSLMVRSMTNNDNKYKYLYDKLSNITHIFLNDELQNRYYYDEHNQLIEENDYTTNENIKYIYDNSGNILSKTYYNLETNNFIKEDAYEYNNPNWEDQLTKFNNELITYDHIGNPLTIGDNTLTWTNGRQLSSFTNINGTTTYKYNINGIRTSKINPLGEGVEYYLENSNIIYEKTNNSTKYYMYDESGVSGMKINNNQYYFIKNLMGDIIEIVNQDNQVVADYQYDSWGVHTVTNHTLDNIGDINPFRYRGYYYDSSSGLYYLNSRYYSPEMGRFINADGIIGANQDLLGYNLYAYVSNNPVVYSDSKGMWREVAGGWVAQSGDTLWGLASMLYGNGAKWTSFGFSRDPRTLQAGEVIKIGSSSNSSISGGRLIGPRDVTHEVNKALMMYVSQARGMGRLADAIPLYEPYRYGMFGLLVAPNGAWDIKEKESWKRTIGTIYPGSHNTTIIYGGILMTPESLGNFIYGYLGAAFGFSYNTLINGSLGVTFIKGDLNTYGGIINEIGDWNYIAMGYLRYRF